MIPLHVLACSMNPCLEEAILSVTNQGCVRPIVAIPSHHWNGGEVTEMDWSAIKSMCSWRGWEVDHIDVTPWKDLPTWDMEARTRNQAIKKIRERMDFTHFLILDSDEIWMPGALDEVLEGCKNHYVVYLHAVPVVGAHKAYPIIVKEGNWDRSIAALSSSLQFVYSSSFRLPGGERPAHCFASGRLLHFTLVGSYPDIMAKLMQSTHWGEPHYEYVAWQKDVLPKIKPGAEDVSFYRNPEIPRLWERVREFSLAEKEAIPPSMRLVCG